jgi:hypothetical protein
LLVYAMKVGPLLLASLVLLGPTETALSATADAASGKRVLVLHSYYKGYKWTDDENRGISAALEPALGVENVFVEYMDTKRFFEERFVSQLPEAYRRKYLDHRIDLIVATDDRALEFLVEHRDEVFPGTPVVFCGVNYFQEGKLKGRPLFTGVSEDVDLGASLDTALALHPGTRRIYVVNEDTETGRAVRTRLAEIGPSWKGVPLEPLDGLPMESSSPGSGRCRRRASFSSPSTAGTRKGRSSGTTRASASSPRLRTSPCTERGTSTSASDSWGECWRAVSTRGKRRGGSR